ncbi:hypothetical protein G436_4745 [Leptospira interrogans serovar Hardjo str. Norma]|uniref:Uncharacterized protein n=1 Tax=Leptospira interrogans serovar Hardjo str. Norma TaxID=1279460 RepID=A0A0M4NPH9_LEPIR|nr:hypothetical protein G436_4745 [Leptospira interrogans serovar Hardjo str. Norma]
MVSWIMAKNLDDCDSILKIFKKSDSEFFDKEIFFCKFLLNQIKI